MSMTRRPVAALAFLALLATAACTDGRRDATPSPSASVTPTVTPTSPSPSASPSASPSPSVSPSPSAAACPTAYAEPDPKRPVVSLGFTVADSKESVTGWERVTFTPDLPVDRLVFRLWANSPVPRRAGGSTRVTAVTLQSRAATFTTSSGGTLVTVPLGRTVPAGEVLGVYLEFTLTLPDGANERLGHEGGTAWFGSGFPLLAWERGRGWATEPATSAFAEAATSEVFRLAQVEVDTAPGDAVLGVGMPFVKDGRVQRFTDGSEPSAVRDVMIAVGRFRTAVDVREPTTVRVGVAPGLPDDPKRLLELHRDAVRALQAKFGSYPYRGLDVAVVPYLKGGVEFPGAILLGTRQDRDATLVHEVGHQWFYGLVGNNQGRDPWLDEAFATYAEAVVRGTGSRYLSTSVPASGVNRVGAPMTYWESRTSAYYRSVYAQGAAMLLRARSTVGAAAWDRAMRCYVAANAHRVVTPGDVRAAFAAFPAALALMRQKGAIPATG